MRNLGCVTPADPRTIIDRVRSTSENTVPVVIPLPSKLRTLCMLGASVASWTRKKRHIQPLKHDTEPPSISGTIILPSFPFVICLSSEFSKGSSSKYCVQESSAHGSHRCVHSSLWVTLSALPANLLLLPAVHKFRSARADQPNRFHHNLPSHHTNSFIG